MAKKILGLGESQTYDDLTWDDDRRNLRIRESVLKTWDVHYTVDFITADGAPPRATLSPAPRSLMPGVQNATTHIISYQTASLEHVPVV